MKRRTKEKEELLFDQTEPEAPLEVTPEGPRQMRSTRVDSVQAASFTMPEGTS
jgi:hypothetical protein